MDSTADHGDLVTTRRTRNSIALAAALLVLTGCGNDPKPAPHNTASPVSNSPDPRRADTSLSTTSSDSAVTDLLPPRPRELDLGGVDPCTDLLTDRQLRDLNYDLGYASPPSPGRADIHGGPRCVFGSNGGGGINRDVGTLISISTAEGALAWVTDPARKHRKRPDVIMVSGFYALVLPHPMLPNDCLIVLDTAEDQYLAVASGASSGAGTDVDQYCEEATQVADMASQTVTMPVTHEIAS